MIIVFGATGYVGRYLCIYLKEQGEDVLALGQSEIVGNFFKQNGIRFMKFDISDKKSFLKLPMNEISGVINLAGVIAEHEVPVESFFNINTIGTYNTLEYCRKNGIKNYILSSSHKLYNDVNKEIIREDDEIKYKGSHTPYIISKIAAENFVKYYNDDFGLSGKILRFTGVHGYGELLGHLNKDGSYKLSTFEMFTEKAFDGEDIEVWGDQSIKRDHIYIKDLISLIYSAIKHNDAKGIFNAASGVGISQLEEAKAIADIFCRDKKSKVIHLPQKPGLKKGYIYSIEKAKNAFKWEPKYTDIKKWLQDYKKEMERGFYHHYHYIKPENKPRIM